MPALMTTTKHFIATVYCFLILLQNSCYECDVMAEMTCTFNRVQNLTVKTDLIMLPCCHHIVFSGTFDESDIKYSLTAADSALVHRCHDGQKVKMQIVKFNRTKTC